MSQVRNATEFLRLLRRAREDYQTYYREQVEEIRAKYANNPSGKTPPDVDEALEAHMRAYFVNALLNALNWRLESSPQDGLPNLIPEAPITSSGEGSIRFLDYLGTERDSSKPLLIVETKRPSSRLPRRKKSFIKYAKETPPEVVCAGLSGRTSGKSGTSG